MALSGCYALVKYLLVFVNLIFWLAGVVVLGVSIWMLTDSTFYLSVTQQSSHYTTGLVLLLAAGFLMFIVGFFGCCGAFKESTCLLVTFFWFLLIILVAEVAAAAWAYSNKEVLVERLKENVKYTVKEEYFVVPSRTVTIDTIQRELHCCGAEGPSDWKHSKYDVQSTKSELSLAVSALGINFNIPSSCCRHEGSDACRVSQGGGYTSIVNPEIYSEGCIDKLIDILRTYATVVTAVGITICVLEIIGLVFSLLLCCAIRNTDHYKA
ncbi:hypothetical protein R5R35_011976 [Gryllus longicercus]|uniref:Tetraspanin n=1 Tax=Gryllus longicercus TaxID=2509291 RepID=A0AAN9W770_9ORTH|nr:Tetraspanin [Gryllus bimaculatus]